MNPGLLCDLGIGVARAISAYSIIMIIYAVISWIPSLRGRWTEYVAMLVEPVLAPVRRIIPPLGGLDISFIVVLLALRFLASFIARSSCSLYY
ncbi:MAG: YggT family protein [Candidatus Eremiobacteraeota bacterium]|nr:YggT family protein [Candidatus Eremiobacteraeota bacterium]